MYRLMLAIVIVLSLVFSSHSATIEEHENRIINLCVEAFPNETDLRYYCILAELYAMKKVLDIEDSPKTPQENKKLLELFKRHYIEKHQTYDFIDIQKEYNEWKGENK